ncbi:hypothetical protein ACIRQP_03445 [Streptomyces sp. NPDC102274]|uniref:hypothetical protein n=1 Tax=Streptomyces sp. NPDC102274 TaxID=3366151 RepID=UPI003815BFA0
MYFSTLPRHARTDAPGWSHPYGTGPFSPVFYADGDPDPDADPAPDADPDTDPDADPDADPDGAEDLGDKGKKALDAMKAKLKTERERRRTAEAKLQDKPAGTGNTDEIQAKADAAATARANARIVRSEVRAAAAGKLADPKDALKFLDLDQFEVDEDGQVDEDEVADAITDLVKNKPYLAAQSGKRFQGTADSGARKGSGRPSQLTRDDLKRMSPEQIVKAKADGRLDDALGITR